MDTRGGQRGEVELNSTSHVWLFGFRSGQRQVDFRSRFGLFAQVQSTRDNKLVCVFNDVI